MARLSAREREDFAAMVRGDHPDVKAYRAYVLSELRCARRRARLLVNEIETIGIAYANGLINDEQALIWLAQANALDFLQPTEPESKHNDDTADNADATDVHSGREAGRDCP